MASNEANRETAFKNTGAVEQDRPEQDTNVAPLDAQLDHRYQDPLNKQSDSGGPEPGQNPEFTGESQGRDELNQDTNAKLSGKGQGQADTNIESGSNRRDPDGNSEGVLNDQDPGERQKENQNNKKDDDLAA